jgi:hypothetical protein
MCIQPSPGFISRYCSNVSAGEIDQPMHLGQHLAILADQVCLDLQAERQVVAMTCLGNLPQLIDGLGQVLPRVRCLGVVKRKAADQLGLQRLGQFAGLPHILGQILLEGHVPVARAVGLVQQLDLANR